MKKFYSFLFALCITLLLFLQQAGAQCEKPVVISRAATTCPGGGSTTLIFKRNPSLTYSWSNGAGDANFITVGAGTYTLTATDGSGCSQTSDPVVIKEKTVPPVIPADTPVLCSGQSLTLYADTGNSWTRKPDLLAASARTEGIAFSIGSKGYVGTGTTSGTFLSDFWEYDEATETWSQKADVPGGGRVFATGFSINQKGYAGLGNRGATILSDWYEYDPFTNIWAIKANYPGGATTAATGFAARGFGYVGLGYSSGTYPSTFWMYNTFSDTWSSIPNFPGTARREAVGFTINGSGYVATGWLNGTSNANDCWKYDPSTTTWSAQAALPASPRRTSSAFTIQNHAYIVCGYRTTGGSTNELWEFYNDTWTQKANFPGSAQWGPASFGLHDKAIVGFGSANNKQLYEYHPNNTVLWPDGSTQLSYTVNTPGNYSATINDIEGCAITTAPLTVTAATFSTTPIRVSAAGTTFCEGTPDTLFAGGDVWTQKGDFPGGSTYYASGFTIGSTGYYCGGSPNAYQFWKYDPATDTWAQQADMPMAIQWAPAISWHGKGWVLGSGDKAMYMYNPTYNAWTKKATSPGNATGVVQGFLLNDKIIVPGGINGGTAVYEYDLVNDTWTRKNDMPFSMTFAPAFALNGKGYLITGNSTRTDPANPQTADCLQYDPTTDSWTILPDFPGGPRGGGIGFTDGHKAYVGMGNHGPILSDLWQLDPATLSWTRMTDIPNGRYATVAMVIGQHAYISTGAQNSSPRGNVDVWQYEMPYNYQWSTGETTRYIKITQTGDYSVQVSNDNGCSAAASPVHVTVQPKTVIGAVPQPVTICDAAATNFSVNASGTNITYQWQLNGSNINDGSLYNGTTTNALSVANVNGLGTGQFQCVVTGTCGTETSTAAVLTVNPLPAKPVITPGSATTFCIGGSVTLNSSSLTGNAWSNGGTTQSTPITSSGSYTLKVTDGNGCISPLSDATVVTVNPLPAQPVITPGSNTTFCQGGSVTLSSPSAAGYIWSNTANTQSINATTAGSYTLQITDGNGCTSPVSNAVVVTVNPLPAQPVIMASGATTFCQGGNVTLSSPAATSYNWSTGSTAKQIAITQAGSYTLQITDANGCQSPISNGAVVTVNPLPAQPVIHASGPLSFCDGNSVTLSTGAAATYQWSTGSRAADITINKSGTYTVRITDNNGCTSPVSNATAVTVNPFPTGAISSYGPVSSGNTHYFQLTAPSSANGTYAWSTGDRTPVARVTQSGTYAVNVTTAQGCEKEFTITVQVIDLNQVPNTFSPNHDGINDYWTVKALDQYPNAVVQIFNRNGNKVFEAKGPGLKWDGTSGGHELPAGVYYYVLDLKDGNQPVNGWINLLK
ncbi:MULTISPECIES: Kelch repeat-containing protein [Niastella]|uniref:Gliding motility-associated C-terminal domain-containing protein n=1 Tax=Niastella soli TaxID=2821487 RepID=A0ABS3Z2X5_9BACT|nr:gliding motility-associated C-terminal domain-containing protein [Niastella soli]MBO9204485.1 gliding motility-associated C-terminal domain-containing protein [Niastella soli]